MNLHKKVCLEIKNNNKELLDIYKKGKELDPTDKIHNYKLFLKGKTLLSLKLDVLINNPKVNFKSYLERKNYQIKHDIGFINIEIGNAKQEEDKKCTKNLNGAIIDYEKAEEVFTKIDDKKGIAQANYFLGIVFYECSNNKDLDKKITAEYLLKAIFRLEYTLSLCKNLLNDPKLENKYNKRKKIIRLMSLAYLNLGECYLDLGANTNKKALIQIVNGINIYDDSLEYLELINSLYNRFNETMFIEKQPTQFFRELVFNCRTRLDSEVSRLNNVEEPKIKYLNY